MNSITADDIAEVADAMIELALLIVDVVDDFFTALARAAERAVAEFRCWYVSAVAVVRKARRAAKIERLRSRVTTWLLSHSPPSSLPG